MENYNNQSTNEYSNPFELDINEINEGVFVANKDGRYIHVNIAGAEMLGYSVEEITQLSIIDVISEEGKQQLNENFNVLNEGKKIFHEYRMIRKDGGHIVVELSARKLSNGNYLGVIRDVTKKRELEDELESAKLKAEMANVAKSQFLANMSHEIRTPMNGVMGFLDILSFTELSGEQRDYIAQARFSCNILLNLINDILDFSKIKAGKLNIENMSFNISELLEGCVGFFRPKLSGKDILANVYIQKDIPKKMMGDGNRLKQIVMNLLSNSAKFTDKGVISVSAHNIKETDKTVTVEIKIKDTGIGIKEEYLPEVFMPFSQQDASMARKYGGTGLGLSITKSLIKIMGGDIKVESKEGEGTCFTVTLTFKKDVSIKDSNEEVKIVQKTDDDKNIKNVNNVKILVVEDNEFNYVVVRKMLEKKNYKCDVVTDGLQALNACKEKEYDIVLMDCQMPVMDGYLATKEIRKSVHIEKQPKIIAMTAHAMQGDRERALSAGMDEYLSKPIVFEDMFKLIEKYSSESTKSSPKVELYEFTDDLKCGNNLIDNQHMELFRFTNELIMEMSKENVNFIGIDHKINALEGYVKFHFSEEERLMERFNYSLIGNHKENHQHFISELQRVSQMREQPEKALNYLRDFLVAWLLMHIKTTDKVMAEFCREK